MRSQRACPLIAGVAMYLGGCSPQTAFGQFQICVGNERGVAEVKSLMRSAARTENLEFIDNSAQQAKDLEDVGAGKALKHDVLRAVDLHIEGEGGLGVTATNLGLPPYQVGLGFTEGRDPAKAHLLADRLTGSLSQHRRAQRVPSTRGIRPMVGCGS